MQYTGLLLTPLIYLTNMEFILIIGKYLSELKKKLEDRSQKKKILFLHSKNKASRKGYKGEC